MPSTNKLIVITNDSISLLIEYNDYSQTLAGTPNGARVRIANIEEIQWHESGEVSIYLCSGRKHIINYSVVDTVNGESVNDVYDLYIKLNNLCR